MLFRSRVEDIMTPTVFTIPKELRMPAIIQQMLDLDVHQLYVVDKNGLLIGVITTKDIVRYLGYVLN